MRAKKLILIVLVLLIVVPVSLDLAHSLIRTNAVILEASLDQPFVVADGKQSVLITVRVTEGGKARRGDLLQSWIEVGGGLFLPEWVYTDETGTAQLTFTPNPLTAYDVQKQEQAILRVADTSIGKLIEIDKSIAITVDLQAAEESGGKMEGMFEAP